MYILLVQLSVCRKLKYNSSPSEFWMIEPELAFADLADNMDCIEEMIKYCINYCLEHAKEEMEFFCINDR